MEAFSKRMLQVTCWASLSQPIGSCNYRLPASYLEKWNYGATVKFINSNYGQYRSNGIAVDVGVLYHDTAKLFSASFVAKNMGTQLKKYDGTDPDDLPFDMQIGCDQKIGKFAV